MSYYRERNGIAHGAPLRSAETFDGETELWRGRRGNETATEHLKAEKEAPPLDTMVETPARTTWSKRGEDGEDAKRLDPDGRLYERNHDLGQTTEDTRTRQRRLERKTVFDIVCWTDYQRERAEYIDKRLSRSVINRFNRNFGENTNLARAIAIAAVVCYDGPEAAIESIQWDGLSRLEMENAVYIGFEEVCGMLT